MFFWYIVMGDDRVEKLLKEQSFAFYLRMVRRNVMDAQKEVIRKYQNIFYSFVKDDAEKITVEDLQRAVAFMGFQFSTQELCLILEQVLEVSTSNVGKNFVEFSHFLVVTSVLDRCYISNVEIMRIFQEFDKDGDGYISPEELRNLLLRIGEDFTELDIQEMMSAADEDGDGFVSFNEFVQVMTCSETSQEGQFVKEGSDIETFRDFSREASINKSISDDNVSCSSCSTITSSSSVVELRYPTPRPDAKSSQKKKRFLSKGSSSKNHKKQSIAAWFKKW
ncbi:calmodulin-like isoform X2 [Clavelina lepadiformis]|uniref:EF-hand domain-containing protein n=3 Tax=Clavelina lepadiformis TaxID=159417 RepID=A0ABP0EWV7_CLALP